MSPEEVIAKWRQQAKEPEGYESPEGLLVRLTIRLCADELESLVRASAPSVAEPAKEPWQSDDLHGFGHAAVDAPKETTHAPCRCGHAQHCHADYSSSCDKCFCNHFDAMNPFPSPSAVEAKEPQ